MRTTVDLPDDLYRRLKAQAALSGVPMRDMLQQFVELGLHQGSAKQSTKLGRRGPPPIIIPPRGVPIPALSAADLRRIDDEEDEDRYARFS